MLTSDYNNEINRVMNLPTYKVVLMATAVLILFVGIGIANKFSKLFS